MNIINVTATLENLLAECVGEAPERVKLNDWRSIALHLSRRLEEEGLAIRRASANAPTERARIAGPIREDETVVAVACGADQAVVLSKGVPLSMLPPSISRDMLRDMFEQAMNDLGRDSDGGA